MSFHALSTERFRYDALRRHLLEADPEIDTPTLADTLEGATDLHAMLAAATRSVLEDQDNAAFLKLRIDALAARADRLSARAAKKRALILDAMEQCDIRHLKQPDFLLSIKTGTPHLVVHDETLIPEWFFIPQAPRLDRTRLIAALKAGEQISGVSLSNASPHLQIRTR